MATVTFKGSAVETCGDLPPVGAKAPDFKLAQNDLSGGGLDLAEGMQVVLNIFPSLDTPVCADSVRKFNAAASEHADTVVLCVSKDLPFAQARFCGAEGLDDVLTLSAFRDSAFGKDYGVEIVSGPLAGLFARAVLVLDADGVIRHSQLVPEIADEPDYDAALATLD